MKIDINKDFENCLPAIHLERAGSETADYGGLLFAHGDRDYGCPLVFFKRSAAGRRLHWNSGSTATWFWDCSNTGKGSIPMLCKEWKYLQKTKKLCGETESEAGQKHRVFTMHPSRKER